MRARGIHCEYVHLVNTPVAGHEPIIPPKTPNYSQIFTSISQNILGNQVILYMINSTLIFVLNSCLQAWQKSLTAKTVSCLSGNSHTCCEGVTDLGSKVPHAADLRFPHGGGLIATFCFLMMVAGWEQRSVARNEWPVTASSSIVAEAEGPTPLEPLA